MRVLLKCRGLVCFDLPQQFMRVEICHRKGVYEHEPVVSYDTGKSGK